MSARLAHIALIAGGFPAAANVPRNHSSASASTFARAERANVTGTWASVQRGTFAVPRRPDTTQSPHTTQSSHTTAADPGTVLVSDPVAERAGGQLPKDRVELPPPTGYDEPIGAWRLVLR